LQRDLNGPERARRSHRVQPGNRRELFFERSRYGGGHRFRAGTGEAGGDLNRREIDIRQIADGQISVAENAEEKDREHQQRRHYRPADENFGEIHATPPSSDSLGAVYPPPRPPPP